VAWFILKCTLEYPHKLAGQKRLLPFFVLKDRRFMESFFKAQDFKGALLRTQLEKLGLGENPQPQLAGLKIEEATLEADLNQTTPDWHSHRCENDSRATIKPAGVGATGRSPLQTVSAGVYECSVV